MINYILPALLVVVLILAVRSTAKHFRGESGCCGGGNSRPQRKRLKGSKAAEKLLTIEGMHCENCRNRVENLLNDIDGASARVNLRRKRAVVAMDREIDDQILIAAVEKGGYRVTKIELRGGA